MRASWEDAAVDHGTTREGSLRYRLSRSLETRVLRRADAVSTICGGLAGDIRSRGVPDDRITVVPNGVDIEDFEIVSRPDEELRASLGLGSGPILGFIGSFYAYEGIEALIGALPRIADAHPSVQALLVGGGPAEPQLRALAASLGVSDRVRFTGRVPHEQVRRYYSVIDVLAYPRASIRLTELVTPLKPLESMSLGRVLIASNVGGHRELLPAHLHPYLFRPGDSGDLARAALQLLAARHEWPALTAASRRYVCEQRTWRQSVQSYRQVYEAVTSRRRTA
jgi:PEP-CTERM/exosortase A-associated glycosyltransferase